MSEVQEILAELEAILRNENELNHMPGIRNSASHADQDPVKSIVKTMAGGMGSFLDLVISKADRSEMIRINDRLDTLRTRLMQVVREL